MNSNSKIIKALLALAITCVSCSNISAQNQIQAQGKTEATIGLSYYKKADMKKSAVAIVKARNSAGKFAPAENVHISFYAKQGDKEQLIKSNTTDSKGQASIILQNDLPLDDSQAFNIVAKIENDPKYADAREQIHYSDANIALSLNPHDTTRVVTAKVSKVGKDGKEIAVNGAEIKFYVQRLFGVMPAAEDYSVTTDEKGEATFAYSEKITGDTAGVVTIVARMEDNEKFGNVEYKTSTSWGIPLAVIKDPFPRELWSPYAPLPLVITISTLFGGVWCVYFYLFFQMWKIKKDAQKTATA